MHMQIPQNTECFNWQFWMVVLYVQTISGVHEHLWYLRAITKTQESERRHMGSSNSQVSQNIGIAFSTWSMGDCKSLDYCCHLTHFCILFTFMYNFEIKIWFVFRGLYIAECGMLFWKAQKLSSNFVTICYRIYNVYVHLKHFLHLLR
jgi:hypothetical protein